MRIVPSLPPFPAWEGLEIVQINLSLRNQLMKKPDKAHALSGIGQMLILFACLKTTLELVNSSAGIYKLLLSGEEGMTLGANFNTNLTVCIALCGAYSNSFAASATDRYFLVIGMNSCFHFMNTPFFAFV